MSILSERIRALRLQAGLTQAQLGARLNKIDSTVRMWELAKSRPDSAALRKMSDIFDVSVDYILGSEWAGECPECGFRYTTKDRDDMAAHEVFHKNVAMTRLIYGFFHTATQREQIKTQWAGAHMSEASGEQPDHDELLALARKDLECYFCRSYEAGGFDEDHPDFESYAGALLNQNQFREKYEEVYDELAAEFPPRQGIPEGTTFYKPIHETSETVGEEILAIARDAKKMSPHAQQKMLKLMKAAFEEAYSEDAKP